MPTDLGGRVAAVTGASSGIGAATALALADAGAKVALGGRRAERLGGLDVLVNGVMLLGPVEGADTDDWRRMVDVNLLALLYCTHPSGIRVK